MRSTVGASAALLLIAVAVAFVAVVATRRIPTAALVRRLPSWARWRTPSALVIVIAGAGLAIALIAVFAEVVDAVVDNDDVSAFDRPIVEWIAARRSGPSDGLVVAVTDIGAAVSLTVLLAGVSIAVAIRRRSWWPLVLAAVCGGGGALLVAGTKMVIARERPDPSHRAVFESGYSFPSGHTASTLVILVTVAWLISTVTSSRTLQATAWVAAGIVSVAVGLSRVYLGVHYPTDVIAGWVLGAAWLTVVTVVTVSGQLSGNRRTSDPAGELADSSG